MAVTDIQLGVRCLQLAMYLDEVYFSGNKKLHKYVADNKYIRKHFTGDWREAVNLEALVLDHSNGGYELRRFSGSGGGEEQIFARRLPKGQFYEALGLALAVLEYQRRRATRNTHDASQRRGRR